MIRRFGSMIGVTLLEILLVLGIAAVIIVMSLRYYSAASATSQVNTYLQQIQAIAAAIESVTMTAGSASTTTVQQFLGGSTGVWALPWGGTMQLGALASGTYKITNVKPSAGICSALTQRLKLITSFSVNSSCTTVTYIPGGSASN
ncbi:MAG: hypothetical protein A3F42_08725 [Gammaproteobacteria bacterium RIFCSPHIGHO2_12_FULL_37_34]|nr:MAG: hypothetical protein A3F42_08725 [Gammaproteobacteria bacterium RIFCSPHIGHO2_12_FULL_37_34]